MGAGPRVRHAPAAGRRRRPPRGASTTWSVWPEDRPPPREELRAADCRSEGLLSLLTDPVDAELIDARRSCARSRTTRWAWTTSTSRRPRRAASRWATRPTCSPTHRRPRRGADARRAARRLVEGDALRAARASGAPGSPSFMLGRDLHGATVGIVGIGRIGQRRGAPAGGLRLRGDPHRPQRRRAARRAARALRLRDASTRRSRRRRAG